jgi:hypothetical protein
MGPIPSFPKGTAEAAIAVTVVAIVLLYGWCANVVDVIHAVSQPITGMFLLRLVGIFVFPLGILLGFF